MTTLHEDLETIRSNHMPLLATANTITELSPDHTRAYSEIVDIAHQAGIGYIRAVALLLKYETERQREQGNVKEFLGNSLLSDWPTTEFAAALQTRFADDPLFTDSDLIMLLTEMGMLCLQNAETDSDALAWFARQRQLTSEQAADADTATRRLFGIRKREWLRANDEFGNIILRREDCVLRVEMLRQAFLQTFSTEFIAEKEQSGRLETARLRLKLIKENPELDSAEIAERLREHIEERDEQLRGYQLSAAYGLTVARDIDTNDSKEDLETARHLLRRLAMLTHPDRLQNLDLTHSQRRQLNEIWSSTHALRGDRDGHGMLRRSVETLEYNLKLAEQILETAGIEGLDAALTIQGDTLQERICWLERACKEIDAQTVAIQAEIYAISSDQELRFMRALVDAPTTVQEEQRALMKKNAKSYRKEAERLEKEADQLLSLTPKSGGLH